MAFPEGGAAARRVLGNALSLIQADWQVTVVSGQLESESHGTNALPSALRVVSIGERDAENLPQALKRARYVMMGRKTCEWLARQPVPPSAVILYSGYTPYLMRLMPLCHRMKVPLVFDAVEWYTAGRPAGFWVSPYLWNTEFALRVLIPRVSGVIAISSWHRDYYQKKRSVHVTLVPPTLDVEAVVPRWQEETEDEAVMRLAYCGSASNDMLDIVLEALVVLNQDSTQILLDVAGPDETELLKLLSLRRRGSLPAGVKVHGRLRHADSLAITRRADFSVFLREVNRVSTAGFPTKFGESLAVGTPVITTPTSDLPRYLRDGYNGLVCSAPTTEDLISVLRRALALTAQHRLEMRRAARKTAENVFDFRHYSQSLTSLLARVGASTNRHR